MWTGLSGSLAKSQLSTAIAGNRGAEAVAKLLQSCKPAKLQTDTGAAGLEGAGTDRMKHTPDCTHRRADECCIEQISGAKAAVAVRAKHTSLI